MCFYMCIQLWSSRTCLLPERNPISLNSIHENIYITENVFCRLVQLRRHKQFAILYSFLWKYFVMSKNVHINYNFDYILYMDIIKSKTSLKYVNYMNNLFQTHISSFINKINQTLTVCAFFWLLDFVFDNCLIVKCSNFPSLFRSHFISRMCEF